MTTEPFKLMKDKNEEKKDTSKMQLTVNKTTEKRKKQKFYS